MTDTLGSVKLFGSLFVLWLLLNGSIAPGVVVAGVVVTGVIALVLKDALSVLSGHRLVPASLGATVLFVLYFLKELVKANLSLAAIVLNPRLPIRPAIVRTETRLTHPVARLLLANAITLTPGTLSVELKADVLYVHWVAAESTDKDTATRAIVAGFERYLEKMYG